MGGSGRLGAADSSSDDRGLYTPPVTPQADDGPGRRALAVVSAGVLLASATWFSGTAVVPALGLEWGLGPARKAWMTVAVQLGFIAGTFLYAVLNLADVFNARGVFFVSSLLGAAANAGFAWLSAGLPSALVFRFLTGLTLAGVYPVGMKIVASWFRTGLGWRLGVMVGALNVGTASPYLVQAVGAGLQWRLLASVGSVSAIAGGLLVLLAISDGPYLPARARFDPQVMLRVFRHAPYRFTAFGYFGHMWELYAFWSLVTFYLAARVEGQAVAVDRLALIAFAVVGIGGLGCVIGGWISRSVGERRVALAALMASGSFCALSGLAFRLPLAILIAYLLGWGLTVVADSPQFSALAARHCPPEYVGTALTVQNGIGFAITVVSIQLTPWIAAALGWRWAFTYLTLGPFAGAWFMLRLGTVDPR
jgi:MFS family permease